MNSNFSKIVRNSLSTGPKAVMSPTVDPDAPRIDDAPRGFSDTDPDLSTAEFDKETPSGVRKSWEQVGEDVSTPPLYEIKDTFSDGPVFSSSLEPTPLTGDVLTPESLEKLDECLRGEMSAVQSYDLALKTLETTEVGGALRQLRDSHDRRVTLIRDRIRSWGAVPSESSGVWGAFARLIQRGADLFGDKAAIAALEEGEDHGLKLYTEDLDDIDLDTREFIRYELLPDQRRTHSLCRSLYRFVKAA
jgi:hypothetical protein